MVKNHTIAPSFTNPAGRRIAFELVAAIQTAKQHLSDIDGLIGDGDHGVNMNKGFTLCEEQLQREPGDLSHALSVLSGILMAKIGGSMGPLYGMFFKGMATAVRDVPEIDAERFGCMLHAAREAVQNISPATPGDKTLMDVLVPAEEAYHTAMTAGMPFASCLDAMTQAARRGRDSTTEMVARVGRSSRLGERSRGVPDAGAVSCCIILESMASSVKILLASSPTP